MGAAHSRRVVAISVPGRGGGRCGGATQDSGDRLAREVAVGEGGAQPVANGTAAYAAPSAPLRAPA
eukprot:6187094-Pleurochrysis_carterae.AAC.1